MYVSEMDVSQCNSVGEALEESLHSSLIRSVSFNYLSVCRANWTSNTPPPPLLPLHYLLVLLVLLSCSWWSVRIDEAVLMSPLQFYCPNKGFKVRGDDRSRIRDLFWVIPQRTRTYLRTKMVETRWYQFDSLWHLPCIDNVASESAGVSSRMSAALC